VRRRIYYFLGSIIVIWLVATTVQYLRLRHAFNVVTSALDESLSYADVPWPHIVKEHQGRCRQLGVRTDAIQLRREGSVLHADVRISKVLRLGGVYKHEFQATLLYRKILF